MDTAAPQAALRARIVATRSTQPSLDYHTSHLERMPHRLHSMGNESIHRETGVFHSSRRAPLKRKVTPTGGALCWEDPASVTGSMISWGALVTTACFPLRNQDSERPRREMLKNHEAHLMPAAKLSGGLVISGENRNVDKQVTTSCGELRIEKSKRNNQFALSGSSFPPISKRSFTDMRYARRRANLSRNVSPCARYSDTMTSAKR